MAHVICFSCRKEDHAYCVNEEKGTVTWCGCQHETGVILQAKDCQHLKAEPAQCPTCGKVMHLNDKEYSVVDNTPEEPDDDESKPRVIEFYDIDNEELVEEHEDDIFIDPIGPDGKVIVGTFSRNNLPWCDKKASSS